MKFQDIISNYLNDNAVFADAFNFQLYSGNKVINPNNLLPLDVSESALFRPPNVYDGFYSEVLYQGDRDLLETAVVKQHKGTIYVLLGAETQNDIMRYADVISDYYDAFIYSLHNNDNDIQQCVMDVYKTQIEYALNISNNEPPQLIILVLYLSFDKVNIMKTANQLLIVNNFELHEHLSDIQISLLAPSDISSEELNLFNSSLREVLGYIKYSNDKDRLFSFIMAESKMIIDTPAALVISSITNTYIDIPKYAKEIDMCNAIFDLISDSRAEGILEGMDKGRNEGIAEGMSRGRAEGLAEGRSEGRYEGILSTLVSLVHDNILSIGEAAMRVDMTEEAFINMLKY